MLLSEGLELPPDGRNRFLPGRWNQLPAFPFEWRAEPVLGERSFKRSTGQITDMTCVLGIGAVACNLEATVLGCNFDSAVAAARSAE